MKILSSIQLLFLGTILSLTPGAFAQLPVTANSGTVVASGLNDPADLHSTRTELSISLRPALAARHLP